MTNLIEAVNRLAKGNHHDPFSILGYHQVNGQWQIRAWLPTASEANIEGYIPLERYENTSLFIANLSNQQKLKLPEHYRVNWIETEGQNVSIISPYTFSPILGELDLHLFAEGKHWNIFELMGAHIKIVNELIGVHFAVWAPSAKRVSVIGSFNNWNGLRHPMRCCGSSGVWEIFIPGLQNGDTYKYEILTQENRPIIKTDPYAQ